MNSLTFLSDVRCGECDPVDATKYLTLNIDYQYVQTFFVNCGSFNTKCNVITHFLTPPCPVKPSVR
jgi:hypothetical protein